MKYITLDRVSGLVFVLISGTYGYYAQQIPLDFFSETEFFNARSLPSMIAVLGVIIGGFLLISPKASTQINVVNEGISGQSVSAKPLLLVGLIGCYAFLLPWSGFVITTVVFLWLAFLVMGERQWSRMTIVAILLPVAFQWLMSSLGIYLDPGELWTGIISD